MKKIAAVLLSICFAITAFVPSYAAVSEEWNEYWNTYEAQSGIVCFPGADETQRNISWYSETEGTPLVEVTNTATGDVEKVEGYCIKTYDGDFANKVTLTGLQPETTYSYKCISRDYESQSYTFSTEAEDFSAMYVTDIHISHDDGNPDSIRDQSYNFTQVLKKAESKSNISLILSAGDQASEGREDEYKGLTASRESRELSFATAVGNHDRKGVAYKYFKNVPNEQKVNINSSYISGDYWFVKGDVLFMVMDSNSGSGLDHHIFMKNAVKANKDIRWRVVMMHHDLYSGRIPHRESETKLMRIIWAPLFDEFGIDLVLTGHSHYYSVSDVMYNNRIVSETSKDCVINNAEGTVCMVSGSINRPRNDDESTLGLNDTAGYIYDEQGDKILYNIIDFGKETIKVSSYSTDSDDPFNTLTLCKTDKNGGHPSKIAPPQNIFIYTIGTIYQFFNNISVYSRLKDDGIDIGFFQALFSR